MRPLMKRIIDIGLYLHCCINCSNVYYRNFCIFSFKKPSNKKKIDTIYMEALNAMLLSDKKESN